MRATRHEAETFGGGNKVPRRHKSPLFVAEPNENFNMFSGMIGIQRSEALTIEAEAILFESVANPLNPGHFSQTLHRFGILELVDLDAIASLFLGQITGDVGGAENVLNARVQGGNRDEPYAGAGLIGPPAPDKRRIFYRVLQPFRNFCGARGIAILE